VKKNVILSFVSLLVVALLTTYTAYSWFRFSSTKFENVIFTSGNINLSSNFWMIKDNNRDGYYDYDNDGKVTLIDTKNMLTNEENIISPQLAIEGDVFSYRMLVLSTGSVPVALTIRLDNLLSPIHKVISWNYTGYTRYRSLLYSNIEGLTNFDNLDDPIAFSRIEVPLSPTKIYNDSNVVAKSNNIVMQPQDVFVFDFQIIFENLEWLQTHNPTDFHSLTDLSVYSNADFSDTTVYIEFVSL
jgi:hypothetical protein